MGKTEWMKNGERENSLSSSYSHHICISFTIDDHMVKTSSQVHTQNQIINRIRSLQQWMFTCISIITCNYPAKHSSPVTAQ